MELEKAIEKITDILSAVYNKGFSDGETKQAILELRGRDKFIERWGFLKPESEKPDRV